MSEQQDRATALVKKTNAAVAAKKKEINSLLIASKAQIQNACAKHVTPERMIRIALSTASRNPKLYECTPVSFLGALIECSQLGLEPIGPLGHAYLVPYKNNRNGTMEVQMMIGYKGLIALAHRSGILIKGDVVKERDYFVASDGVESVFEHRASLTEPRGEVIGAFAIATLTKDRPSLWKAIGLEEIYQARSMSKEYSYWEKNGKKGKPPIWEQHFEAMAIKTAIRRLSPFLPMSPEFQAAVSADELRDQGITVDYEEITDGEI